jgi:hypothetical protein
MKLMKKKRRPQQKRQLLQHLWVAVQGHHHLLEVLQAAERESHKSLK